MASGLSSLYKGSDELTLDCDVCKYQSLTSQAISYCEICTEALCQVCDNVHRASKQTRKHKLLTGNQIPWDSQRVPAEMMCDTHQLPIEYFCNKDNEVLHRSCDTAEITKEVAKTNPGHLLGKLKHQFQKLENKYQGFEKKRSNDKDALKTDIQACFDELTRIRHDINGILDEMERKMKAEISAAQDKVTKEIDDHLVIADDTLRQTRESIKLLNESEKTQQDDVMCVATKKTENILPNLNSLTQGLRPFAPHSPQDLQVKDVIKFSRQGGKLSQGTIKFIGHLPGRGDIYLGVELDKEDGKHDGTFEGVRFFKCKPSKGAFVAYSKVVMAWTSY